MAIAMLHCIVISLFVTLLPSHINSISAKPSERFDGEQASNDDDASLHRQSLSSSSMVPEIVGYVGVSTGVGLTDQTGAQKSKFIQSRTIPGNGSRSWKEKLGDRTSFGHSINDQVKDFDRKARSGVSPIFMQRRVSEKVAKTAQKLDEWLKEKPEISRNELLALGAKLNTGIDSYMNKISSGGDGLNSENSQITNSPNRKIRSVSNNKRSHPLSRSHTKSVPTNPSPEIDNGKQILLSSNKPNRIDKKRRIKRSGHPKISVKDLLNLLDHVYDDRKPRLTEETIQELQESLIELGLIAKQSPTHASDGLPRDILLKLLEQNHFPVEDHSNFRSVESSKSHSAQKSSRIPLKVYETSWEHAPDAPRLPERAEEDILSLLAPPDKRNTEEEKEDDEEAKRRKNRMKTVFRWG